MTSIADALNAPLTRVHLAPTFLGYGLVMASTLFLRCSGSNTFFQSG